MSTWTHVPKLGFKTPLWSRSFKHFINNSNQQTYIKHSVAATTKVIIENKPHLLLIFNRATRYVLLSDHQIVY